MLVSIDLYKAGPHSMSYFLLEISNINNLCNREAITIRYEQITNTLNLVYWTLSVQPEEGFHFNLDEL